MSRRGGGLGAALALLGAALACPAAPAQDWPQFKGGPSRDGRGPALGLPAAVAWSRHLRGSLYSSPAIVDGKVLLGSSAKRVYCLDLRDGSPLWEHALTDRVWGCAPAVAGGKAYIGSMDGCVHALGLADGADLGRWCGKSSFLSQPGIFSSPLVASGTLLFGSDDQRIYAWNLAAGEPAFSLATGGGLHDNAACACGGTVFMASRDDKVYALALADGSRRWTREFPKPFNTVPACDGRRVYLGGGDSRLLALDAQDGSTTWSAATGGRGIMSSPALGGDGSVVFGSSDHSVYCLDAASGARRWAFKTGDVVLAGPLITGGVVWVGSFDGSFYALDLRTGARLWSTDLDGGVFTAAAASGDSIVVAGRGGDVVCVRATAPPKP